MASHGTPPSTDASVTPRPYARDGRNGREEDTRRGAPAVGRRARSRDLTSLVWLLPLALAATYLVVFVVQLPHNVVSLTWNSDYAGGYTVPEALAKTGTAGNMVMGSAGQWVLLWFGLLTASLPLHRELWDVAPTLLFLASALVVGWSVAQLAGRRAALLAALLAVVASPLALVFFMAAVAHNTVYPCTALLGAYLIWLTRIHERRRLLSVAVPPLVGVAIGTCLASDPLLAATALVPLGVTAGLAGIRRERRSRLVAASAIVTLAVAVPVGKLTTSVMHSLGFATLELPAKVVPLSELPERAGLLFRGLKALFNGYLGPGRPGTLHAELGVASTIVMSAALWALVVVGAVTVTRFVWSGLRKDASQTPLQLARSLHVIYWVGSAAAACGAFWIAGETGGGTNLHESYYATTIFSVAAIVPAAAPRPLPRPLVDPDGRVDLLPGEPGGVDEQLHDRLPLGRARRADGREDRAGKPCDGRLRRLLGWLEHDLEQRRAAAGETVDGMLQPPGHRPVPVLHGGRPVVVRTRRTPHVLAGRWRRNVGAHPPCGPRQATGDICDRGDAHVRIPVRPRHATGAQRGLEGWLALLSGLVFSRCARLARRR